MAHCTRRLLKQFSLFCFTGLLAACSEAPQPAAVNATNVDAARFSNFSCSQLSGEWRRNTNVADRMETELKRRADNDEAMYTVWAVSGLQTGGFTYGDSPLTDEYAEVKGNLASLEIAMIDRDCANLPF